MLVIRKDDRLYSSWMKRYDQYCPIAHALGAVGERWSLLIVRDLLKGPRRYTDLAEGLPGIGTNVLASRLRDLESAGIVTKRRLAPPAPVTVYELTDYGRDLEETIHALARWGARTIGPPSSPDQLAPGWLPDAIRAIFDPAAAVGLDGTFELRVGEERVAIRVVDGTLAELRAGGAEEPDLVLETDGITFYDLVARTLPADDAVADGRVRVEGDPEELERLVALLSFAPRNVAVPATLV